MGNRNPDLFPTGFPYQHYSYDRSTSRDIDPFALDFEAKMIRARSCANQAVYLRDRKGFTPDVICAHTGWGEELFLKDVWPSAKLIGYCEYFYNSKGYDLGFDDEFLKADSCSDWKTIPKCKHSFVP